MVTRAEDENSKPSSNNLSNVSKHIVIDDISENSNGLGHNKVIYAKYIDIDFDNYYEAHFGVREYEQPLLDLIASHEDYKNLQIKKSYNLSSDGELYKRTVYINVDKKWIVVIYGSKENRTTSWFVESYFKKDIDIELQEKLVNIIDQSLKVTKLVNYINLISFKNGSYSVTAVPTKDYSNIYSVEHYNDNFIQVEDKIKRSLIKSMSGIILLHGNAGTGKTSYIKHLLSVTTKPIYYVSPDMIHELASPSFNTFMIKHLQNSILIIEDAENVIKNREAGGSQAVSNLLNISDGLLGDLLNIIVVCTFNTSLDQVDSALMRPGRLIAEYEFKKLSVEKTAFLIKKLYDTELVKAQEMTLADIYNYEDMPEKTKRPPKVLGFMPQSED